MKSSSRNVQKSKVIYNSASANRYRSLSTTSAEENCNNNDAKKSISSSISIERIHFKEVKTNPEKSKVKHVSSKSDEVIKVKSAKNKSSAISKRTVKQKREKAKGHKVGILHYNYPEEILQKEQLILVQEAILEKVKNQADEIVKPRFHNSILKPGWLLISCADRETVDWLKGLCNRLKPWTNASLMIAEEKDIPNGQIFIVKFPHSSDTNEQIIRFLKAQNAGLFTEDWKVHNRTQTRKRINITFVVDQKSAEQLKQYSYKLSFKFGVVHFRPKKITNLARFKIQQAYNEREMSPEIWLKTDSSGSSSKENL